MKYIHGSLNLRCQSTLQSEESNENSDQNLMYSFESTDFSSKFYIDAKGKWMDIELFWWLLIFIHTVASQVIMIGRAIYLNLIFS